MSVDGEVATYPRHMQYPKRTLTIPEKREAEYRYIEMGQTFQDIADYLKVDLVTIYRLSRQRAWAKKQAKKINAIVKKAMQKPEKKVIETFCMAVDQVHKTVAAALRGGKELSLYDAKMLTSIMKDLVQIGAGSGAVLPSQPVRAEDLPPARLEALKEELVQGLISDPMTDVSALLDKNKRAEGEGVQ